MSIQDLEDAVLTANERISRLQEELSKAQSDYVGARENLRRAKEQFRRAEQAKVIPVYGSREFQIDHLRQVLPGIIQRLPESLSNRK
ncbi:MAG: hypothetical protein ABFD50_04630 [Smithella sp.]